MISQRFYNAGRSINNRWAVIAVCILLAVAVWIVFGQTLRFEFVNFDDNMYVYENPIVQKGLTLEGFRWALTFEQIGHWHPLTWLSHMLDCRLYGLHTGRHHFTSLLLHCISAILLFLLLRRMTGSLWRSAFVAAVFAIHPLRAESVAWVSERKDVLSAFFFMLTLVAYVIYVRRPFSMARYGLVVLLFALGLLSKNMLVTMPFVLLLLDYWPLNRFSGSCRRDVLRLTAEKIPLLVLAISSCVATMIAPEKLTFGKMPFGLRLENAVVSYVTYLWQMVWPSGLACVYPNPVHGLPFWQVAGAAGLLLAITGAALAFRKKQPSLAVGWLWYLGMMVPVIGIVQISYYAHADRYTYLPQIGLYMFITWAAADRCVGLRHCRATLVGLVTIICGALIFCARTQVSYWRNSESLWTHTLACTSGNYIAHGNLGELLYQKGRLDEAISQFQSALRIKPDYADACYNLGNIFLKKGNVDEAIAQYRKALEINPNHAVSYNNLGTLLSNIGRTDEALAHYLKALDLNPNYAEAHNNLGTLLAKTGRTDEAMVHFLKALEINPDYGNAHYNFGLLLADMGRTDEAIAQYRKALEKNPNDGGAHFNLGTLFAKMGRTDEAMAHYLKGLELNPDNAEMHNNLGILLADMGRTDEAIAHYRKTLEIKPDAIDALQNLAFALVQKGQRSDATSVLQKALALAKSAGDEARAKMIAQTLAELDETINSPQVDSKAHVQR